MLRDECDLHFVVRKFKRHESGRALEVCLSQIDGSRPFFVCLLGSRYGWVPPGAFVSDAKRRFQGLDAFSRYSVKHLEILHGAFGSLDQGDGVGSGGSVLCLRRTRAACRCGDSDGAAMRPMPARRHESSRDS